MSTTGLIVAATAIGVAALWLLVSGFGPTMPSLVATVRSLRREPDPPMTTGETRKFLDRMGASFTDRSGMGIPMSTQSALRVIDRPVERHVGLLVAASLLGFVTPTLVLALAVRLGVVEPSGRLALALPAGAGMVVALLVPVLVHSVAMERAAGLRLGLRHQLSAFVDLVTTLLAGNAGHEGALRDAARAGDGRLFRELRRRMREVGATGRSLIDALDLVADDFDLPELRQIAATGRLAASEGAPVARSLAARCSTIRSTLAADQEAEARIRTDKVTPPLVGMTVLFMAVIIFPALNL